MCNTETSELSHTEDAVSKMLPVVSSLLATIRTIGSADSSDRVDERGNKERSNKQDNNQCDN